MTAVWRKIWAITVMVLLLFNWVGYRLLNNALQHRADKVLQASIEQRQYDPDALIEISVALDLPYTFDWQQWESVQGTVVIEGIPYQYVERILRDGKMVYRCLPNHQKQQLLSARDRFVQLSYDISNPPGQKAPAGQPIVIKPVFSEFEDLFCLIHIPSVTCEACLWQLPAREALAAGFAREISQPPNA